MMAGSIQSGQADRVQLQNPVHGLSMMAGSIQSGQADRVELQNPQMACSEELGQFCCCYLQK